MDVVTLLVFVCLIGLLATIYTLFDCIFARISLYVPVNCIRNNASEICEHHESINTTYLLP